MKPVYILIRTSNRPEFFKTMYDSIKNQTYKNIVIIVHSDDPRDDYVKGDIIIRGQAFYSGFGNGTYNLYNNRLLRAIKKNAVGWYHFIDDDDMYAGPDVIEKLVENSKEDHINVARVERWNGTIWPKHWESQKSFQTECFFLHTDHRLKAKWWGNKGGDHHYSKQLTKVLPINWIDKLKICKAQEGKGHGKRKDKDDSLINYENYYDPDKIVCCLGLIPYRKGARRYHITQGQFKEFKYKYAYELEQKGIVKITNSTTYIER